MIDSACGVDLVGCHEHVVLHACLAHLASKLELGIGSEVVMHMAAAAGGGFGGALEELFTWSLGGLFVCGIAVSLLDLLTLADFVLCFLLIFPFFFGSFDPRGVVFYLDSCQTRLCCLRSSRQVFPFFFVILSL